MSPHHTIVGYTPVTHDRPLPEQQHDAYKSKAKPKEPTVCPQCNAVYHEGRWQWARVPADAHEELCPACHRINDQFPSGFVTLEGPFFQSHTDEVINLVRNHAQREKAEHPLKRIMAVEHSGEATVITTTDIHLARGIGDALEHAYGGKLDLHYNKEDNLLRVHWTH